MSRKKTLQPLDRFELRLSGLGGQGIITLGKILGQGLAIGHGYYVTQTQSYGPEARGGSSRCDLVISSSPISYPKTENLDLLISLSQQACNAYYRYLKPNGLLVVDTSMVKHTPTNVFKGLPFTDMAKEKIGLAQTLNILVMGAVTHLLPFAQQRVMKKALEETMPPKILPINQKAFALGYREAGKHFGEAPVIWQEAEQAAEAAQEDEEHV